MALETATFISQLVATNPVGATDPKSQGDDHIRMLKAVLQAQFPNLGAAAVTATAARLSAVINAGDNISFTGANSFSGTQSVTQVASGAGIGWQWISALPGFWFVENDVNADTQQWRVSANGNALKVQVSNDARSTLSDAISIARSSTINVTAVTSITFGNATDNPTYTFSGSGSATFNGQAIHNGPGIFNSGANIVVNNSGGAANAKNTLITAGAGFNVASATDAAPTTVVTTALSFGRTGAAWTTINFGNATDNPAFAFLGTGAITANGVPIVPSPVSTTTAANAANIQVGQTLTIRKTAQTSRASNTVLTADPDLQFTNLPAGTYELSGYIPGTSGAGGYKWDIAAGGGTIASGGAGHAIVNNSGAPSLAVVALGAGITQSGVNNDINLLPIVTAFSTAAALIFEWAQNVSNAANTIVLAGAYLKIRRVA